MRPSAAKSAGAIACSKHSSARRWQSASDSVRGAGAGLRHHPSSLEANQRRPLSLDLSLLACQRSRASFAPETLTVFDFIKSKAPYEYLCLGLGVGSLPVRVQLVQGWRRGVHRAAPFSDVLQAVPRQVYVALAKLPSTFGVFSGLAKKWCRARVLVDSAQRGLVSSD